jgi:hypothetical protein
LPGIEQWLATFGKTAEAQFTLGRDRHRVALCGGAGAIALICSPQCRIANIKFGRAGRRWPRSVTSS